MGISKRIFLRANLQARFAAEAWPPDHYRGGWSRAHLPNRVDRRREAKLDWIIIWLCRSGPDVTGPKHIGDRHTPLNAIKHENVGSQLVTIGKMYLRATSGTIVRSTLAV